MNNIKLTSLIVIMMASLMISSCSKNVESKVPKIELCGNGVDDDGDSFVDRDDLDCKETGGQCSNGIDDDKDGFIDEDDLDCKESSGV